MTFHLSIPAILILLLSVVSLVLTANTHGKPRSPENFWTTLTAVGIQLVLLWWGGFFQ